MKELYKDYLPANARIVIDYTSKEKVKFTYPIDWTYKKAVWKRGFATILGLWVVLNFIVIFPLSVIFFLFYTIKLIFFPYIINAINTSYIMDWRIIISLLPTYSIIIFYVIGIPAIVTYFLSRNKEMFSRFVPWAGEFSSKIWGYNEKIFNSKDVQDNKLIIPIFSNVFINWKGTKDFSEFLERIEIMEVPFTIVKMRSLLLRIFTLFLIKPKKENNDLLFRATFYFSRTPVIGELSTSFI